jgi:hypothetical protein
MKLRCFAAAVVVGGSALLAGCPFGVDLGALGLGSGGAIPDGTYAGTVSATVEFWNEGELSWDEASDDGYTDATFSDGALAKDSGGLFKLGDVDSLADGAYDITREVYDIDVGDWGYEIAFDSTGEWNGIPMTGWEVATYWLNDDGTVDLYDEIELTSEEWYDGGAWTIYSESYATLSRDEAPIPAPAPAPAPSQPPQNILDLKSGKIRR